MMSIVLLTIGWLAGWWLLWRVPALPGPTQVRAGAGSPADVAVVIPARNEASNVAELLRTLEAQTLRVAEVVVVDDESDDGTGAVARAAGATVVVSSGVPPTWA